MCRDREAQSNVHAGGIMLHGSIEKFLKLSECHNFVKLSNDLSLSHAEDRAVEKNVFATGQLRMKSRPNLKQTRHPRPHHYSSLRGISDARDYFQQCAFAGAVAPDDTDDVSLIDVERNVF